MPKPKYESSTANPSASEPLFTRRKLLTQGPWVLLAASSAASAAIAAWAAGRWRPPKTIQSLFPVDNPFLRPALYWRPACDGVQCTLCPIGCFLPEGQRGVCRVRANHGGRLVTLVYGHAVSVHLDPIEKKPVFHMLPGTLIYSLATVGCSLRCRFCQNWSIAQAFPEEAPVRTSVPAELRLFPMPDGRISAVARQEELSSLSPENIVKFAKATRCRSVAYTYSEPMVFYEYVLETAKLAKKAGLRNVMVSCGYVNPKPLAQIAPFFDVIKVDLKGFNEKFYRDIVGGELRFVLRTLTELKSLGVFAEIVNLVIPGRNDDPGDIRRMCRWLVENMGKDIPISFSRFHPDYHLQNLPSTPIETLEKARAIAMAEGLRYAYIGNVPGHPGEHTYCPRCGKALIRRQGYAVLENLIGTRGTCPFDGTRIPGIWQ